MAIGVPRVRLLTQETESPYATPAERIDAHLGYFTVLPASPSCPWR